MPTVEARHIEKLERLIDEFNEIVGPLTNFLLPGGSPGAAQLHVARTVCRRAEREATTLARDEPIGATVLPYLNRLSDALFVMARYENHERGVAEPLWRPGDLTSGQGSPRTTVTRRFGISPSRYASPRTIRSVHRPAIHVRPGSRRRAAARPAAEIEPACGHRRRHRSSP